jgi:uncharacterized protein YjbI with pentapeptide repeats
LVWNGTKENAALVSLVGVVLTLLVTTVLTQLEGIRQRDLAAATLDQQVQQESLQTYLGDMGGLILRDTSPLPEASPDDAVSQLARAKTLTVLGGLGSQRKGMVLQFLSDAQLIQREGERAPIITLSRADLGKADLNDTDLRGADLSDTWLAEAELFDADLSDANLSDANLSDTLLLDALLLDADLSDANLLNAHGITKDDLEQQAATLKGATMPDGSEHP